MFSAKKRPKIEKKRRNVSCGNDMMSTTCLSHRRRKERGGGDQCKKNRFEKSHIKNYPLEKFLPTPLYPQLLILAMFPSFLSTPRGMGVGRFPCVAAPLHTPHPPRPPTPSAYTAPPSEATFLYTTHGVQYRTSCRRTPWP